MIWEGIHVHTGYICRQGRRRKQTSAALVRILHRTASPYYELMESFWETEAVSLHILTHDQTFIHPEELSGHHPVFGLNSVSPQCTFGLLHCHLSCSHITFQLQQSPRLTVPARATRTHKHCEEVSE